MFHLREGLGFGGGSSHGVGIGGVHQTLEHHPAVVHVAVDRQVDPAEAAVRDASLNFVLAARPDRREKAWARRRIVSRIGQQKPSVAPGCPSLPRPTGSLHSWLPQNRCRSGTCGSVRIAADGSPLGTGGIETTPAPRRPRPVPDFVNPVWAARPGPVAPLGALCVASTCCVPVAGGAMSQTSQWPATTVPPHPGSAHLITAVHPHSVRSAGQA